MRRTINLFMWEYQPHFRLAMIRRARRVLHIAGADVEPKALLVGVRRQDVTTGHEVCVEPEDEDWDPSIFSTCAMRAASIFADHPDHGLYYGDEPSMRDKPENIRRKAVRQAVVESLADWDQRHSTSSFFGSPTPVNGYLVVPVLQFARSDVDALPRMSAPVECDGFASPQGLLDAIVEGLLREASNALQAPEPGRWLRTLERDPTSLLREAGDRFCEAITLTTSDPSFQGVFDALNAISALRYEGGESKGSILFAARHSPHLTRRLTLLHPVSLENSKLARKAIEMTGRSVCCLCYGEEGISELGGLLDPSVDGVLRVEFVGHHRWDLFDRSLLLMRVAYGVPRLPSPILKEGEFRQYAARLFPGIADGALGRVWAVVAAAVEQKHGTMVTVSRRAAAEAARLASQALPLRPTQVPPDVVGQVTRIDGAILLDEEGICHAIGVILDGLATTNGDPSRGARYNSAVRYVESSTVPSMCIVVSEDGDVDLVPKLRPLAKRSVILANIEKLRAATIESYFRPFNFLDKHRFYLTADECAAINGELNRILATPIEVGEIRFSIREFVPDPRMNASFYCDESDADR